MTADDAQLEGGSGGGGGCSPAGGGSLMPEPALLGAAFRRGLKPRGSDILLRPAADGDGYEAVRVTNPLVVVGRGDTPSAAAAAVPLPGVTNG